MRDRLIAIWESSGLSAKDLEDKTGIDRNNWYSLKNGRRRANEDDIKEIVKIFPQYAYWLTTGQIIPEAGQVSPDYEELARLEQPKKSGTHD